MNSILFSPLVIGDVTIKNRVVLSPMLQYSAQGGHVNDWHLMHLGKFAAGGVGLVFCESTKVDPRGCSTTNDLGLWKDEFIEPLKRITNLIKANGAIPGIQLSHSGRKARLALPWEGRVPLAECLGVDHGEPWELIGPSAIAHSAKYAVPRAMTLDDIQFVIEAWGKATERAIRAGFEVIEIHGGHGYLIHQFLSERANQRTDQYGGSLENRIRFALEVAQRVRQSWPRNKPLFFRVSAVDECGWTIEDSIVLARALKQCGVDVIDCSSGGMSDVVGSEAHSPYSYQVPYAEQIRAGADIQTMAVGMIVHADQAEQILQNGHADLIAIGRELLHNPNWAIDAAQKLGIQQPFSHIARVYAFWLEKRARSSFGKPSTWQNGIGSGPKTSTKKD
jgi:2,4-dienoyl-CoA reductase-like NADH-dependent reductase (Old Yellow Enzyme family)